MSADNFYVVREVIMVGGLERWYVTMGFASSDVVTEHVYPDLDRDKWFDNSEDALEYAVTEYSEYGVSKGECVYELLARRLHQTENLQSLIDQYVDSGTERRDWDTFLLDLQCSIWDSERA